MCCRVRVSERKVRRWIRGAANTSLFCNTTLQCRTRQSGPACAEAIQRVCRCPPSWKDKSYTCLKACIRDSNKRSILEASCPGVDLEKVAVGEHCTYLNPEDCMSCVKYTDASTNVEYGVCECDAGAPRCSKCTNSNIIKLTENAKNAQIICGWLLAVLLLGL